MKPVSSILMLIFLSVLFQGCNTLFNTRTINIEIVEPGRINVSPKYKNVAVKYNNCNVGYNPQFATYFDGEKVIIDSINTDSISSKVYYEIFVEHLIKQDFFESITVLNPADFSGVKLVDSLIQKFDLEHDTILTNGEKYQEELVSYFTSIINLYPVELKHYSNSKTIDPKLGLYSKQELKEIAETTNADILFSFDYYASLDGINFSPDYYTGYEKVQVMAFWNFYDLQSQELQFLYTKIDTISWRIEARNLYHTIKELPPRKDAILNAADITATRFAEYLIPHWIEVQRMYYHSGHVDIKKTDRLIKENKWMEAAKIWKANINNPNKNIAAKCRFNMALVCEMEGNLEAAVDWVIQSFHVFGSNNNEHYYNCLDYINILNLRNIDIKKIDLQFSGIEP